MAQQETKYFYDSADRLIRKEQILPNEFNVNGRYVTEFTYDPLDRVSRKLVTHKRGNNTILTFDEVTFEYLELLSPNLVTRVLNKNVDLKFSYLTQPPYDLTGFSVEPTEFGKTLGLKKQVFKIVGDKNGPRVRVERNGEVILRTTYDQAERILSIAANTGAINGSVSLSYDGYGRKTLENYSNSKTGSFGYDDLDRLTSLQWASNSVINRTQALTYDHEGLITQSTYNYGTFNYSYTKNNEVASVSYTGSESYNNSYVNTSLSYNNFGDITNYHGTNYESFNNFRTKNGSLLIWPEYSGLGGRMIDTKSNRANQLRYDPEGRLVELRVVDTGSTSLISKYYYDGLGRRIAKVKDYSSLSDGKTIYTHYGLEDRILFAETSRSGYTNYGEVMYVDGPGIDEHLFQLSSYLGMDTFNRDHLGSILGVSATSGGKNTFGLFGENLGSAALYSDEYLPVNYGFAGREYDTESGYYYNRARMYDPQTGTFLTRDPLGPHEGGDWNSPRYARNNPVNFVDPMGLDTQVITTTDTIGGITFGSHSAVRVDNSGSPVFYDPGGTFQPRGSGDTVQSNMSSYIKYQTNGGSGIEIYNFPTTASQEALIAGRIEQQGGMPGGLCALGVCNVIQGVGPFSDIKSTYSPGSLRKQLENIPGGSCGGKR